MQTQAVDTQRRLDFGLAASFVSALPGLAVFGIAVLYAAGALIKTTELQGAGVKVRDTLPLIPIEQLLSTGIGTIMTSLLTLVFTAAVVAAYWLAMRRESYPPPAIPIALRPITRRSLKYAALALTVFAIGLNLLTHPFFLGVGLLASFFSSVYAVDAYYRGQRTRVYAVLIGAFLVNVAANVANAYVASPRLPAVRLTTRGGDSDVRGSLLVFVDHTWYVVQEHGLVRAIPATEVTEAHIRSRNRPHQRTFGRVLIDLVS